jgi:hypothetical protein
MRFTVYDPKEVYPVYRVSLDAATRGEAAFFALEIMMDQKLNRVDETVALESLNYLVTVQDKQAERPRVDNIKIVWTHEEDQCGEQLGCTARAEVSYQWHPDGDRRIEWFTSGGYWGIDVNENDDYRTRIEGDQLDNLKEHLEKFGVDVSRFEEMSEVEGGAI